MNTSFHKTEFKIAFKCKKCKRIFYGYKRQGIRKFCSAKCYHSSFSKKVGGKFLNFGKLVIFRLTDKTLKEATKVKEFICNFIDFLDEPEVERVFVEHDVERMKKRIKRGKTVNPIEVHIRLNGKIKEYFESIETGLTKHFSHSFWIKGHWRHFRAKYYKNKIGTKSWIKPYIRGKGILVKKDYEVKKD